LVNGNTEGLSKKLLAELESFYQVKIHRSEFFSGELALHMAELTQAMNREISVYVNRKGEVVDVSVGEAAQVSLKDMRFRRSSQRLSGIRCVHTHPGGDGRLSKVDMHSLKVLRFDAMAAIGVKEGRFSNAYAALLNFPDAEQDVVVYGPMDLEAFCGPSLIQRVLDTDRVIGQQNLFQTHRSQEEKAILVGLDVDGHGNQSLDELEALAHTAGANIADRMVQNRRTVDPATYIGYGKAREIALAVQALDADIVIFDDELTAAQIRNLEHITGVRVVDRTALILDIFASRASSREGKLQVELAQLKYRLPRLTGMGISLSRLGGGIGTRGPGEKKLETDRRHIHRRIREIQEELKGVEKRREALRTRRERDRVFTVALVGYTNSGKSTLLNALAGSSVLAEDKLFATLDPVSRGIVLDEGQEVLLIDTVGFINKLPHDLVEAFHSTLEEAVSADLLLHVVDASSDNMDDQMKVVDQVLKSLGANQPLITVFNKMDKVKDQDALPVIKPMACISAVKKEGLNELLDQIKEYIPVCYHEISLLIPYQEARIASLLHDQGSVLKEEYQKDGIYLEARVNEEYYSRFRKFEINSSNDCCVGK
jgi:GTP-binding protein HflX